VLKSLPSGFPCYFKVRSGPRNLKRDVKITEYNKYTNNERMKEHSKLDNTFDIAFEVQPALGFNSKGYWKVDSRPT